MYYLIDSDLLEKNNTIWDNVSADIKKEFDREPIYNKKFLKTKLKSRGDEVTKVNLLTLLIGMNDTFYCFKLIICLSLHNK